MSLYKNKYRIESSRLSGWDYSNNGFYFITICTKKHKNFFGKIKNGISCLNELGKIAEKEWIKTGDMRKDVILDEFVVMPNHFHCIIELRNPVTYENCDREICLQNRGGCPCSKGTYPYDIVASPYGIDACPYGIDACPYGIDALQCVYTIRKNNVSNIIRGFKGAVTKQIHILGFSCFAWQSRFYDRIIRNERELNNTRKYIRNNPLKSDIKKGIQK